MKKYYLKQGSQVYATGVFLIKDDSVPGGWRVGEIEDDVYHDGMLVNDVRTKPFVLLKLFYK